MTPRGDLEPRRDIDADTVAGILVGSVVGSVGWMIDAWTLVLPVEWTMGAGWWAPIVACAVVGGMFGRWGRGR